MRDCILISQNIKTTWQILCKPLCATTGLWEGSILWVLHLQFMAFTFWLDCDLGCLEASSVLRFLCWVSQTRAVFNHLQAALSWHCNQLPLGSYTEKVVCRMFRWNPSKSLYCFKMIIGLCSHLSTSFVFSLSVVCFCTCDLGNHTQVQTKTTAPRPDLGAIPQQFVSDWFSLHPNQLPGVVCKFELKNVL